MIYWKKRLAKKNNASDFIFTDENIEEVLGPNIIASLNLYKAVLIVEKNQETIANFIYLQEIWFIWFFSKESDFSKYNHKKTSIIQR